jgi:hypothetical protein
MNVLSLKYAAAMAVFITDLFWTVTIKQYLTVLTEKKMNLLNCQTLSEMREIH